MKPKTLMLLCVAVGCGLVAMIGVQQALNKPKVAEVATMRALKANADINAGEPLNEQNVTFVEIPEGGAPEDVVTKPEEFALRSLKVSVMKGDYVTKGKLNEKGVMGKSAQIPQGSRVATINVDETQTSSNMLNPGDKVDVVVTFDVRTPRGMETRSTVLLERVDVFAVADKTKNDQIRSGDANATKARQISLLVTPEEMTWLSLAQRKGQLTLMWRNPTDKSLMTSKAATDQLLADLRGLDRDGERPEVTVEQPKSPAPETKPAAKPDLHSFLDAANSALSKMPAPVKQPASGAPSWEVKVYKGNTIQSYPFEITEKDAKKPAEKSVEKPETPKSASLWEKFLPAAMQPAKTGKADPAQAL